MQTPYQTNAAGHLSIGGVDANELAQRFGTPLYAYDVGAMRQQMRDFKRVFEERHLELCGVICIEGLCNDCDV